MLSISDKGWVIFMAGGYPVLLWFVFILFGTSWEIMANVSLAGFLWCFTFGGCVYLMRLNWSAPDLLFPTWLAGLYFSFWPALDVLAVQESWVPGDNGVAWWHEWYVRWPVYFVLFLGGFIYRYIREESRKAGDR